MSHPITQNFIYTHTMIRVKDAQASLHFYTQILGMRLLRETHYEEGKFSLFFLGYVKEDEVVPSDSEALKHWLHNRSGLLELTHNWGTENDPNFQHHTGNVEPRGFGHICLSVPNFEEAIAWFDQNNVPFQKRPEEGKMRDIAFLKDPDGYWVEIVKQ